MRGHRFLLLGLVVFCFGRAWTASGVCAYASQGAENRPGPYELASEQWLPGASYPGGRQYDPRLERTVSFWGSAVPLREVFRGIKQQTGVEIVFCYYDRVSPRLCLNLFLCPDDPPTLRELMVQVGWVTECAFGVLRPSSGDLRYQLLGRTTALDPAAVIAGNEHDQQAQSRREKEEHARANLRGIAERLAELRDALLLSRRSAISRYTGVDDVMLLALLDPARRAGAEMLCGLADTDTEALLAGNQVKHAWGEWSAEQQELVRKVAGVAAGRDEAQIEAAWVGGMQDGRLSVYWEVSSLPGPAGPRGGPLPKLDVISTARALRLPDDVVALAKLLGQVITPAQETAVREAAEDAQEADIWRESAEPLRRKQREVDASLAPAVRDLLSELTLPIAIDQPYTLAEVQERVAAVSGLHVVSDCFWQPLRDMSYRLRGPSSGQTGDPSALSLLAASTVGAGSVRSLLGTQEYEPGVVGWEWGSAGRFLRFRSEERDLWRASMIPAEYVDGLDSQLDAALGAAAGAGRDDGSVTLVLPLRDYSWLAGRLTLRQLKCGSLIAYGTPDGRAGETVAALRHVVMSFIADNVGFHQFLCTLDDEQWRGLLGEGLKVASELTPDQQQFVQRETSMSPDDRRDGQAVLRLTAYRSTEGASVSLPSDRPARVLSTELYLLTCSVGSRSLSKSAVVLSVSIRVAAKLPD